MSAHCLKRDIKFLSARICTVPAQEQLKDLLLSVTDIACSKRLISLLNMVVDARLEEVALDEFFSACVQVN